MGGYLSRRKARASGTRRMYRALQNVVHAITRQRPTPGTGERDPVVGAAELLEPVPENSTGMWPQGNDPLFATFTLELQERTITKVNLMSLQTRDLRDACAAVVQRQQQGVVTPPFLGFAIRRGQECVNFFASQVSDELLLRTSHGNSQYACDQRYAVRVAQCHKAEERANGRQSKITRARRVATLLLQVVQKRQNCGCIDVANLQRRGFDASAILDELKQQAKRIPVAGQRARTDPLMLAEVISEKCLPVRAHQVSFRVHSIFPMSA